MPIFCISDLHLCDRGPRDNFCIDGRENRFHRFLDYVQEESGKLYILGDLFDWWQVNLSKSMLQYEKLINKLCEMDSIWIVGNHDNALINFINNLPNAECFFGISESMSLPFSKIINEKKTLFMHGHEADPYCNNPNPGIGEITAIISGIAEDRNKSPNYKGHVIEDRLTGTLERLLTRWRKLTKQNGRLEEIINGVEEYRKKQNANVVFYGHTHEAGQIGDYHYNCGCWCRKRDTFVRIEDNGTAKVLEWTKNCKPKLYEKVLQ